jgi:hypothetical protein
MRRQAKGSHQRLKCFSQHRRVLLPIVAVPTLPQRVSPHAVVGNPCFGVGDHILNCLARSQPLLIDGLWLGSSKNIRGGSIEVDFGKTLRTGEVYLWPMRSISLLIAN